MSPRGEGRHLYIELELVFDLGGSQIYHHLYTAPVDPSPWTPGKAKYQAMQPSSLTVVTTI